MELLGWWALVPQAVLALITGMLPGLVSRWGLLRHHWVVVALVLTTVCTGVLVLHMPNVSATVDKARTADAATLGASGATSSTRRSGWCSCCWSWCSTSASRAASPGTDGGCSRLATEATQPVGSRPQRLQWGAEEALEGAAALLRPAAGLPHATW